MSLTTSVYHHTGLESSGGATRVARLIMDGLQSAELETSLSFELGEGADSAAILPEDFGRYLPPDAIAHVHCTGNWPALLDSLTTRQRTVVTMHDCELFTGGCPYPLDCSHFDAACDNPCPRNFPSSFELRKRKHELVQKLDPVLVSPSRWLAKLAKAHLFKPVEIIPNGIPWPTVIPRKRQARTKLGINPAAKMALFVAHGGTSAAYKSGPAWKTIWKHLKARIPELLCFAVGGDTAGKDGDLVVWPYVARDRIALLMSAADVLLYPTKADNHSLVVLEAMAQALPIVSYSVGGIPEQITHQVTGLLVEPGEQDDFIQAAANLLQSPHKCREMGQAAFFAGHKRFSSERMVADYMKLYANI